jgi:hypothetical protein
MYHMPPCWVAPLSLQHCASTGCGTMNGLQLWKVVLNTLNKHPRTADKSGPPVWVLGLGLTLKNVIVTKHLTEPRTSTDSLDKRHKLRNMDMEFGTWNIYEACIGQVHC